MTPKILIIGALVTLSSTIQISEACNVSLKNVCLIIIKLYCRLFVQGYKVENFEMSSEFSNFIEEKEPLKFELTPECELKVVGKYSLKKGDDVQVSLPINFNYR